MKKTLGNTLLPILLVLGIMGLAGTPLDVSSMLVGGILVGAFIVALAIVLILFRPFDSLTALPVMTKYLEAQIEGESTALFSTGRLWDDGIIHPADSRTVLGMALSAAHSNVVQGATEYGVWRH